MIEIWCLITASCLVLLLIGWLTNIQTAILMLLLQTAWIGWNVSKR